MNRPTTPTTCNVSDLLNSIFEFVRDNENWMDDEASVARIAMAYMMFTKMCDPDMCTDAEETFVLALHADLQEITNG